MSDATSTSAHETVAKIRLLDFPAAVDADGRVLTMRYASSGDRDRITAFAETLPSHDLLFLRRDITDRNEVAAWLEAAQGGRDWTLLALENDQVAGYVVIAGDPSPWSRHVAELRVLVSPGWRERGLGRLLVAQAFALGQRVGYERMVAQMTPDQVAAQRVFERLGFENEATLRGRVVDREGTRHDLVVMGLDLRRLPAQTGVLIEAAHDSAERSVRWEGSAELVDSNGIVIAEVAAALWKLSVEGRGESWGGQLSLSVSGEDTLLLAEEVAALRLASADPVEIATHGAVRMDLGGADPADARNGSRDSAVLKFGYVLTSSSRRARTQRYTDPTALPSTPSLATCTPRVATRGGGRGEACRSARSAIGASVREARRS